MIEIASREHAVSARLYYVIVLLTAEAGEPRHFCRRDIVSVEMGDSRDWRLVRLECRVVEGRVSDDNTLKSTARRAYPSLRVRSIIVSTQTTARTAMAISSTRSTK